MKIKNLIDEDFIQYKKPSMFIGFPNCSFKCDKECGQQVCQNSKLAQSANIEISKEVLCERYLNNPLTSAIVCGGLEPFDSKIDLITFVDCLRRQYNCNDDIVIYTGYYPEEIGLILTDLKKYDNIIIKFGRFIPNKDKKYDEILGVTLASDNQYARRVENI